MKNVYTMKILRLKKEKYLQKGTLLKDVWKYSEKYFQGKYLTLFVIRDWSSTGETSKKIAI